MQLLNTDTKNKVLDAMMRIIAENKQAIIEENQKDLDAFTKDDQALYDSW